MTGALEMHVSEKTVWQIVKQVVNNSIGFTGLYRIVQSLRHIHLRLDTPRGCEKIRPILLQYS